MASLKNTEFSFIFPTLGSVYIGSTVSAILYGVTNMQIYLYYRFAKGDSRALKNFILILWILDTLHQAFVTHVAFTYSVTDFDSPITLIAPEWSVMAHVFVASTSDTIVRGLFCRRVYLLSGKNWPLAVSIAITALGVFATSWAFAIKGLFLVDYYDLSKITWFIYSSLILSVVVDLLIAGSLCILLSRRSSLFSKTNSMLRTLMIYSINTGALTSICAIACLTIYATLPSQLKFVFVAIYFVLPKLLLNALLATLNARRMFREEPYLDASIPIAPLTSSSGLTSKIHVSESKHSGRREHELEDNETFQIEISTNVDVTQMA